MAARPLPKLPVLPPAASASGKAPGAKSTPPPPGAIPGLPANRGAPQQQQAAASSREAMRTARDLHDQQVMGLAPLSVDTVSGEEISPHVPRSIQNVPWFHSAAGSQTLTHQKREAIAISVADLAVAPAGLAKAPVATPAFTADGSTTVGGARVVAQAKTYRPGACKNCGSMTHKEAECTERRRAVSVVHKPVNIAPDVVVDDGARDRKTYEQKRDRTAGVDMDATARAAFATPLPAALVAVRPNEDPTAGAPPLKSLRCGEEALAAASTTGSLRSESRELPKYLINLNAGSAIFDPATRAMRGNPQQLKPGQDERYVVRSVRYEGDNARSQTGGSVDAAQQLMFAYHRSRDGEAGQGVSPFLPTANDMAFKAAQSAEAAAQERQRAALAAVYGTALTPASASADEANSKDVAVPQQTPPP